MKTTKYAYCWQRRINQYALYEHAVSYRSQIKLIDLYNTWPVVYFV